ncbi:RNA-directed DNA polymerase, eukaryota, reverse transcriptase zinc-binding domain protein [Tanacetum coccineum]
MMGININDLTIEQYLRLTSENQTPSMVKKVDEMTINEYMEYEERIKRQYSRSSGSYFPTYSSHNTTIECPSAANFNAIQSNIKFNYDSEDMELDEKVRHTTDEESVTSKHEALDPAHANDAQSLDKELSSEEDLDEWLKGELEKHMSTVKNASVKIDKFEFSCDFVVTDMPENLGEIIILGRPFLETTHTQIDVFQEEISLGIGKDRIKFGVNGNLRSSNSPIEKVYMANTVMRKIPLTFLK